MTTKNSFFARATRHLAWKKTELQRSIRQLQAMEFIFRAVDERPFTQYETSISLWEGLDTAYLTIFYKVPSIKEMISVLEFFEQMCAEEFTSKDIPDEGYRSFTIHATKLGFQLELRVTPDENAENPTCRKVVVGERVETNTTKTPIYELICN